MPSNQRPIFIATRGSALALAQTNMVLAECRAAFPDLQFEIKIIKTTGDKMQTLSLANPNQELTKGLFTKELEIALLNGEADLAVHSLKDLPTELPEGLILGAVGKREDVRDVLVYRNTKVLSTPATTQAGSTESQRRAFKPHSSIRDFPSGATIATSSVRRQAQLLAMRPDLRLVPIRGNVGTRLQKLVNQAELDGLVLAAAGLHRLGIRVSPEGELRGDQVPEGLLGVYLPVAEMLPCVGQGAIGIEVRRDDSRIAEICARLNHSETSQCVTAERAFLHAMGGGCLSPLAACADLVNGQLRLRAASFRGGKKRTGELTGESNAPETLGKRLADEVS